MAESRDPGPEKRRCPAWIWAALLVSLGANLMIGGIYLGQAMRGEEERVRPGFAQRIAGYLPEARRAVTLELLADDPADLDAKAREMLAATARVAETLTAEPFDPAALSAALDARLAVFRSRFEARSDGLVALAERLDPDERADLAAGLSDRTERWIERVRARAAAR